jgi:hypothetical protein
VIIAKVFKTTFHVVWLTPVAYILGLNPEVLRSNG